MFRVDKGKIKIMYELVCSSEKKREKRRRMKWNEEDKVG